MIEGLYVHIPFCGTKCSYCDFNSYSNYSEDVKSHYLQALKKEGELVLQNSAYEINLKTVFLGGGTPTCLASGLLLDLVLFLIEFFPRQSNVEITMEANPGTLEREKINCLLKAGVNRVSLGVQSFDEGLLKAIGREQMLDEVWESIRLLRSEGLDNLNLDLMYGLPHQTISQWEKTLKDTLIIKPEHVSLYQLKIEEDTPLGQRLKRGEIEDFCDEQALEMYKLARHLLSQAGYIQYEISNFALKGYKSAHNQLYWQYQPYLGLGAGAHSYLPPNRIENLGSVEEYIKRLKTNNLPPRAVEELTKGMAMSEYVFMGLRMIEGISLKNFQERFNQDLREVFPKAINKLLNVELIKIDNGRMLLTEKGIFLGNLVFQEFLIP